MVVELRTDTIVTMITIKIATTITTTTTMATTTTKMATTTTAEVAFKHTNVHWVTDIRIHQWYR
jgi:hypothetical protein